MADGNMTMTYSTILHDKDNKKFVRVMFDRESPGKKDTAEGLLPDCVIVSHDGYSEDELASLEAYMKNNLDDIMSKAKVISNPLRWF